MGLRLSGTMRNGLTGEIGVIKLWSDYQNFTNQLFERYQFKKLSIENSAGEWDDYHQRILDFLDLNLVIKNRDLTLEERKDTVELTKNRKESKNVQ